MAKLKSKQVQLVVGDFVLGTSSLDPNYDNGFFTGLHSGSRISDAFATISLQMVPFSSSISSRVSIINTLLYNVSESNSTRLSSLEALTSSLWTASNGIIRKVGDVQISGSVSILNSLEFSAGAIISKFSTDGTLGDNSDSAVPTEKAIKNYVDSQVFLVSSGSVTGDGSQLYLAKWVSSSSITSSGIYETSARNVGIGTILPQGKLHVNGTITASNLKISSNISASDIYINNQSFVLGYSSSVANRITTLESSTGGLWTSSDGYISRQSNVKISGSLYVSSSIVVNGTVDGVNISLFSSSVANDINSLQTDSSSVSTRTSLLESTASDHENRITTLETVPAGLWTSSNGYINRESDVKITGSLYLSGSSTNDILYKADNGQLILIPQPTSSVAYLMWSASSYFWVDSIDGGSF